MNNPERTPHRTTGFQPVPVMSYVDRRNNPVNRHGSVPRTGYKPVVQGGCLVTRIVWLFATFSIVASGCQDNLGTGGSGELVIPREQLRRIEPLDLRDSVAATQPSTQPTTQPAGPPPAEVALGIEDCRRMALVNNLDLQVQLFAPALAHTQLTAAEAQFEAVFLGSLNGAS